MKREIYDEKFKQQKSKQLEQQLSSSQAVQSKHRLRDGVVCPCTVHQKGKGKGNGKRGQSR